DHQVGGGIIATQRKTKTKQAGNKPDEIRAEDNKNEEGQKHEHLENEHALASEVVGQATQRNRADENAGEAGCTNHSVLSLGDVELIRDKRKRYCRHEYDEALEEFSCCGETPDAPLHGGHGGCR